MRALLQKLKLFMQRSSVSITAPLICQKIKVWGSSPVLTQCAPIRPPLVAKNVWQLDCRRCNHENRWLINRAHWSISLLFKMLEANKEKTQKLLSVVHKAWKVKLLVLIDPWSFPSCSGIFVFSFCLLCRKCLKIPQFPELSDILCPDVTARCWCQYAS